ncbi:glycosyltransferase family 1 protein [Metabacillus litoralis]|uniref:glycosyltransferase family 1 protein n=1 Tax=Metabacillus litoralis TaxID=152268 RepID=UPI001CFD8B42|nr:glycosyltransferase family 1 protein [Metabacillus litoralis]
MSVPIRILQVFAQMNRGGAETMIMNLYRNIDRSLIQFDFIVHTEDKCAFDDEIKNLGGRIFRIPAYNGKNHMIYKKKWKCFFDDHPEYKIVHGHVRSTAYIYLKIAKKYGIVTVAHSHSTSSGNGVPAIIKNIFQYPIRYVADHFLACSKEAGEWLFGNKTCRKSNFHILKNAISTKDFVFNTELREKRRKEFELGDKFVVGHVGRFNNPKNHDFIVDIFKAVHEKHSNSVLMLIGEGDLRQSIEKKVNDLGLTDHVIFAGVRSDIPELLQAIDIFLFPSLYEGLGIVVIEAQTAGLQCLVSKGVPKEVSITNLVEFISLKKRSCEWADVVLKYLEYERLDLYDVVEKSGYDIVNTAEWVKDFYLKVCLRW